ncbi:hypothetical protein E2320_007017, partial [Naja naja]
MEGLNAFPVQEQVGAQGQTQYEWTPLPYTVLRELRKSISETRLQGILEGISNAYHLVPQDWKDMMRMLLTPVQYVVWDSEYERYAIQAGNNSGGAYIPDQLYGAGAFSNLQQQATGIPVAAYPAIGRCVLHAFKKVPVTGKPSKSFLRVWVDRCVENIPLMLVLIPTAKQPTAVLTQELTTAGKSSMNILEWIYLSHSPGHTISSPDTMYSELILKAREHSLVLLGLDIVNIILPIPLKDWEHMLHLSSSLQLALMEYVGKVSYHIPADQNILSFNRIPMSMYSVLSPTLLPEAIT